ncbi:MAG TPA: citrate/2-methylcitrate synthase [Actinomycetes bacterium]|nr:citrate/2-methylcitrate synthase [Actinomycetes bacterium]
MEWISTAEAASRLGVKPATLYAYVSRGMLRRRPAPGRRGSLFDPAEIDSLARQGRARRRSGIELTIESGITALIDEVPYYRGVPVTELAKASEFESVAALLWTGELTEQPLPWQAATEGVAAGRSAQSGLPEQTLLLERLQVVVAALAAADPLRLHFEPAAVAAAGQNLIAGMVDCLPVPVVGEGDLAGRRLRAILRPASDHSEQSIAARLWDKLGPRPPAPAQVNLLRAALVLLADHELAASTFAARVAASVRADPYAVVAAGLGVVGGALHGGASLGAEVMLAEVSAPGEASYVVGERLRRGERIPGFGHFVYRAGDPRATLLLDLLAAAGPNMERLAVVSSVLDEARRRRLPEPNIDFALAALAYTTGMVKSAAEAVFAIARTAGWIAHALEEYQRNTPLRPRAVYTGPLPGQPLPGQRNGASVPGRPG